ncbi:MAG: type II secretion system F family protein [Acidimicrobiia bacterium]|nr:type II secretion system F family protein [Acidimicrobiia bacterium]
MLAPLAVEGTGLLGIVALGTVVAFVIYLVAAQADEKAVVRSSLRQLEGYEVENVRDRALLTPFRQRALVPAAKGLTDLGRRLTPQGYVDKVRKRFVYAGEIGADAVDRFLAIRVITIALVPLLGGWVWFFSGLTGMTRTVIALFVIALLVLGPDATLNRKAEVRQRLIRIKLPDVLDLLTISVEAGLGFEQALDRTVAAVPGPLSDEFQRMLGEVRAGASRGQAMRGLQERSNVPELRSFVLAILQADTFGVSIGRVLRAQADEMRIRRRQFAQELAQKAPVKMLIPMVFCIFPALFVVVLGPAVINIANNLA